jgi:hypothetical protein
VTSSQQKYRCVVMDVTGKVYSESTDVVPDSPSGSLNAPGTMNVTVPLTGPTINDYLAVSREVALWRDGMTVPIWRGPMVRPSNKSGSPATRQIQCQDPLWYLTHRYFGSPAFPTNYLVNGSFEVWGASPVVPVDWTNSGGGPGSAHLAVTQLTLGSNPGLVMLGNSSAQLVCSTANVDTFLGQVVTTLPSNGSGLALSLSGWFYLVPGSTAGPLWGRGLFMQMLDGSGNVHATAEQFSITTDTPAGLWLPAQTQPLDIPAAATGGVWRADVRAYCPVGTIIWDGLALTIPESLSPAEPGGSDQSLIMENIVLLAQGQAATGGVGFVTDSLKSNLHITPSCPATGTLRADLVYDYTDRRGILDALNDFPTFYPESDFAIVNTSATARQFQTFGRTVTDGQTTQGSNTFLSATGAFTIADAYQPLTHQNIPGGACILPAGLTTTPATSCTFSGSGGALASGSSLYVFIGGRAGTYKPSPLFMDATASNLANVSPFDNDGDQMATSVSATPTTSAAGAAVGVALQPVVLGTLTSARNASSTYTTLLVTAITAPVNSGDLLRVGVASWQPGVGQEGEAVIASANAAVGATSISIVSHTFGSTWAAGQLVTDFTAPVTMEDVLSAVTPTPVASLMAQARVEMEARASAVAILTVQTANNFIDTWCGGTPLVAGDVLNVTVNYGGLVITNQPYRINSWTLDLPTDSYSLQLNLVSLIP